MKQKDDQAGNKRLYTHAQDRTDFIPCGTIDMIQKYVAFHLSEVGKIGVI